MYAIIKTGGKQYKVCEGDVIYVEKLGYGEYHEDLDVKKIEKTLLGLYLQEEQKVHIVRMFRVFLQGFLMVEIHGGFGNPTPLNDTFGFALKTILNGIRDLQGGTAQ